MFKFRILLKKRIEVPIVPVEERTDQEVEAAEAEVEEVTPNPVVVPNAEVAAEVDILNPVVVLTAEVEVEVQAQAQVSVVLVKENQDQEVDKTKYKPGKPGFKIRKGSDENRSLFLFNSFRTFY